MSVYRVGGNKSSQNVFPSVRPTLDLDFANSKTLDPRITFTRSSGGSYVGADGLIKYAGVNEARFDHDPSTGESLGLLVEEARTNLLLRSEEFDIAYLGENAATITANATTAPDGTLTADTIVEDTSVNVGHRIWRGITFSTASSYTFSVFVKAKERTSVDIRGYNPTDGNQFIVRFNLIDGSVITTNTQNFGIIKYPNGWYRFYGVGTFGARFTQFFVGPTIGAVSEYTGDGTSGIYLWGAQIEQGSFPTSYIPTQGSTRTRAADNASITGKNFSEWYRQDEGTIYVSQKLKSIDTVDRNSLVYLINGGSGNDIFYNVKGGDTNIFVFGDDGTNYSRWQENGDSTDTKAIWAYDVSGDDFKPYWNGIEGINESNSSSPSATSHTQLEIGATSNAKYNGHISKLTYYPRRLTNAQLQALTK